ncbi:MAG: DeoR/GlpR family DNA-binding transcription regulator [Caldilineaceae bacterium]
MLTDQRKQYILEVLKKEGQVVAKKIAQELDLSEDTIRRDLRELAQEGHLQRVHGGALPASPAVADFPQRQQIAVEGKAAIGRAAAQMIQPGQVVILDGGTTAVQIARQLPPDLEATIVTHSPSVAVELAQHKTVEVVLIGGKLFKHSVVAVGAAAIEALSHIHADTYFMGVTGIHPQVGLTTGDLEEAYVKRALHQRASETVVLASAEKLGGASAYVISPIAQVSGMIVEKKTEESLVQPYREMGVAIFRA